ncbi:MAG: GspH/FimT family pseudopilin [Cellvibrionaceae bacterium]|nr:GspH/FimT family pseudopilin [Cellvibrionaceae bacterium]
MCNFIDRSSFFCRRGFTLVELLVTLALVSLLIAAGVPGVSSFLNSMEVRSNADQLANALAFARQEAVSRVTSISICASADGESCAGNSNWGAGWMVFEDPAVNCTRSDDEEIFRVRDMSAIRGTLQANIGCLTYDSLGENAGADALAARACGADADSASARDIAVSLVGAVSVSKSPEGASCP